MNTRIAELRSRLRNGYYRQFRRIIPEESLKADHHVASPMEASLLFRRKALGLETPVVLPDERIFFTETLSNMAQIEDFLEPAILESYEYSRSIENLTPDWELLLREGIEGRLRLCRERLPLAADDKQREYYSLSIMQLEDVAAFARRYAAAATTPEQRELLEQVPIHPARSFHEALQSIRFMTGCLRASNMFHLGFGRFDQYMMPYLQHDLDTGRIDMQEARELLAEFFLSLNRDTDLYDGVQLGDNGQSLMLGGCGSDGKCVVNPLTWMVLEVAEDLALIDPKINLRVDSATPRPLLVQAARLTRRGLGFPQYCNDDVVIPGLVAFGYPLELARDYTVAACWEFVLRDGRDIPNFFTMNLPLVADRAIRGGLRSGDDFEGILARLNSEMRAFRKEQIDPIIGMNILFLPDLLFSAFFSGCLERGRELHDGGASHYNYGCHGAGAVNAANALAAVKQYVFDEKSIAPERLLHALEQDWQGEEALRSMLLESGPHVGNGSELADSLLKLVFDVFADTLAEAPVNSWGGRIRPGTGSAQRYVTLTQPAYKSGLLATADGRKTGDYIGSSLSGAPGTRSRGILSLFHSFGKLDYRRLVNGGPITLELSDRFFQDAESLEKTAMLVEAFVRSGNQQLQLNTLNPQVLREAQKHPENYRDLVVRVWGWSGYFVELSREYQEQIIGRQAFGA